MKQLPNLSGLVAFDVVARHLNFSAAGRELHITQSAVSHRIRALEDELGVQLFQRSARNVALTDEGAALYRATSEAFVRLRAGVDEVEAIRSNTRLTVSCSPSFAIRWLVPHLGSLRQIEPGLEVHIAAQDQLVRPGVTSIDVCIRFGPGDYPDVIAEELLVESLTPVCSPSYAERLALREPRDLLRCDLLHDNVLADHPKHLGWPEWFEHVGLDHPEPGRGTGFSHAHLALDAAVAGHGIALGRQALTAADRQTGLLISPFDLPMPSGFTYWFLRPQTPRQPDMVRKFHNWLVEALAADRPV